jgi:hypothetical protein
MAMRLRTHMLISVLVLSVFSILTCAEKKESELKAQIYAAISSGADYAAFTLLDENGKSRCDYNLS